MNVPTELAASLVTLLGELLNGSSKSGGYMLNGGDDGLLRSLDRLSSAAASASTADGSSVAAHVDHLRYGLSLMNRWGGGEDPFQSADWSASWRKDTVTDDEWNTLRADLRSEAGRWLEALRAPRQVDESELSGLIGSIVHLAYHMGAIRQIARATRGPAAQD